ncbi:hypothetical protein HT031_005111 [Scenedesmus sp. PABB004]|nr:hypothetical protein HT031_005111 [Scenedesmus sp. PABB004]
MATALAQQRLGSASARDARSGGRAASAPRVASARPCRAQRLVAGAAATDAPGGAEMKTVVQKITPGEVPFPWSEKDPYRLPVSIERVQKMLVMLGWEKPWVEQIVDRVMKGMLKTTEERCKGVIDYLSSIGLRQDEICNMASISVVLLGLNPETRLAPVVAYCEARGVPRGSVADLVLRHPRIFEYKVSPEGKFLVKGAARIQVDAVPLPDGSAATAVNYFRENTSFLGSPVSPMPPSA